MDALIVFDSQFGNTQKIAEMIAAELRSAGRVEVLNVHTEATTAEFPQDIDLLIVGGPTQMHGVTATLSTYIDGLPLHQVSGIRGAAFDTRARGWPLLTGQASKAIAQQLKKHEVHLILPPESFLVSAKEGPLVDGELERAQAWAHRILAAVQPTAAAASA